MGEGRKGGERRNGRNTRVWHKKNLDTGMRKAEREREKEQMPRTGEKSTKQYLRVVVIRSVRLPRSYLLWTFEDEDLAASGRYGARWR